MFHLTPPELSRFVSLVWLVHETKIDIHTTPFGDVIHLCRVGFFFGLDLASRISDHEESRQFPAARFP